MSHDALPITGLGFGTWESQRAQAKAREGWEFMRVMARHRTRWIVSDGVQEIPAELTGRLSFRTVDDSDHPTVGDWVLVQPFDGGDGGIIDDVLERRTVLERKTAGHESGIQVIAANVDTAFIVQSCDRDFNERRLERYLIVARQGGIRPVILLTKTDLVTDKERLQLAERARALCDGEPVCTLSTLTGDGLSEMEALLEPRKTCCLLGSSGVGKTTLLNHLMGSQTFRTAEVRESDHRGRHTTTARHLVVLDNGALIIDTPGMRELGLVGADDGLAAAFDDISTLAQSCHYSDCAHEQESGCAVQSAIEDGRLDPERLRSWSKLQRESQHHEASLAERRRKDKAQGKLYKRIMKAKKDRR